MKTYLEGIGALVPLSRWRDYQTDLPGPIDWIVEHWLSAGDITILASDGGLGKSWKAAMIALKVCEGGLFDGTFPVKRQGNVLWIDNENGPDETHRRCWKLDRGIGFQELRFKEHDVHFHHRHWTADEAGIRSLREQIRTTDPSLVVIDSLVSIFPGGMSENAALDVRMVMDRIADVLRFDDAGALRIRQIACLVLHHTKKGSDEPESDTWPTFRGSGDFKNAATFMVIMRGKEVRRADGSSETRIQSKWVKARRGRMPKDTYEFALKDHGEPDEPGHWVEYVAYGRAGEFWDYLVDKLRDVVPMNQDFVRQDLIDGIKGFPENREQGSRLIEKLIENGLVTLVTQGRGPNPTIYRRIS